MTKVTMTIEVFLDSELYTNEDFLVDEVKEHILYGLDRLGVDEDNVTFVKTDVEGM